MASPSPAKRRKLSLDTPWTFNAPGTPVNRDDRHNEARTAPARRESYMSPTRASLSRFNPHLLPQAHTNGDANSRPGSRGSAPSPRRSLPPTPMLGLPRSRPPSSNGVQQNHTNGEPMRNGNDDTTKQQSVANTGAGPSSPRRPRKSSVGGRLSASPKRRSQPGGNFIARPRIPRSPPRTEAATDLTQGNFLARPKIPRSPPAPEDSANSRQSDLADRLETPRSLLVPEDSTGSRQGNLFDRPMIPRSSPTPEVSTSSRQGNFADRSKIPRSPPAPEPSKVSIQDSFADRPKIPRSPPATEANAYSREGNFADRPRIPRSPTTTDLIAGPMKDAFVDSSHAINSPVVQPGTHESPRSPVNELPESLQIGRAEPDIEFHPQGEEFSDPQDVGRIEPDIATQPLVTATTSLTHMNGDLSPPQKDLETTTTTPEGSPSTAILHRSSIGTGFSAAPRRKSRTPGHSIARSQERRSSLVPHAPTTSSQRPVDELSSPQDRDAGNRYTSTLRPSDRRDIRRDVLDPGDRRNRAAALSSKQATADAQAQKLWLEALAGRSKRRPVSAEIAHPALSSSPAPSLLSQRQAGLKDKGVASTRQSPDTVRKGQELEKLQAELTKLQEEVGRLENAIERGQQDDGAEEDYEHVEELLSLLAPEKVGSTVSSQGSISQSSRSITAFLPFSRPIRSKPITSALPIPDDFPASHHPLDLSSKLPYLQLFTPLSITSTTSILPEYLRDRSRELQQTQIITLKSSANLLFTTLSLTHTTESPIVTDLTVSSLSPWAEHELGTWIRDRARGNSVAGKDISSVCWAIGRYWEAAENRAHVWRRCEREFAHLISTGSSSRNLSSSKDQRPRTQQDIEDEEDDSDSQTEEDSRRSLKAITRRDLLSHLGRSSITFCDASDISENDRFQLKISWPISFDWTGEAQSRISASADIPQAWTEQDTLSSLSRIPEVFSRLLRFEGLKAEEEHDDSVQDEDNDAMDQDVQVMRAIRGVVQLLFR